MKTLSLPLRGHLKQLSASGGALFALTRHTEDLPLSLSRLELSALLKGELRGEAGLSALTLPQGSTPLVWAEARAERVWAMTSTGELLSAGGAASALELTATLSSEPSLSPNGIATLIDEQRLLWADVSGGLHLWSEGERWSWGVAPAQEGAPQEEDDLFQEDSASEEDDEASERLLITSLTAGEGVVIAGLSDGSIRLWLDREGGPQGEPITISAHSAPVCALTVIKAEGKAYLVSACEGLELYQTRLDDLTPMSRASKGKGLHTTPVRQLVPGPLGRFYSVGSDGAVKAWRDAYSNVRPASHDDLGELRAACFVEVPVRNLDGEWPLKPALALATQDQIDVYLLEDEPKEEDEASRGRLGERLASYEGVEAWLRVQRALEEPAERLALIERLSAWGDALSLEALATLASRDQDHKVRASATEAILASAHPRVVQTLERLLDTEDHKVGVAAFHGLRKARGEESLDPMRAALRVSVEQVGEAAVEALAERAEQRDEEALSLLKEQLSHSLEGVAQATSLALTRALPQAEALLYTIDQTRHLNVKVSAVQRLYRAELTHEPLVSVQLQSLREHSEEALRGAALSATLLSRPALAHLLSSRDQLLHEQLRTFEALDLKGEAREAALKAPTPKAPNASEISAEDRQALFELSACSQPDIASYGPVALAELGDLRALPILLALSRADEALIRARATRGLAALASAGEQRASAQLERLCDDHASEVRLAAYRGLEPLLASDLLRYVEVGLSSEHHDVRLASISAAQRLGLKSHLHDTQEGEAQEGEAREADGLNELVWRVLKRALSHPSDLELAREARKLYLRDEVGGDALNTHLLLLESPHEEVRRASLHDMMAALKAGRSLEAGEALIASGGGGITDLSGQSFVFTGTLSRLKRSDAQKKVQALGGSCPSGVSADLSFLVIGDEGKAGSKLDKAKKLGVRVLSEAEFMDLIGEGTGGAVVGVTSAQAPAVNAQSSDRGADGGADGGSDGGADGGASDPTAWITTLGAALLEDPSRDLRAEVRRSLLGDEEGKGALKDALRLGLLTVALRSPHLDNRLEGVKALNGVPNTEGALKLLIERLDDPSAEVSTSALRAALKLSDEAAEQLLSEGLSHVEEGVREATLSALIAAPKRASWRDGLLWRALEDASPRLRAEAMSALKGDEAVAVAERLLDSPHTELRLRAAMTLAKIGDERALGVVLTTLTTPQPTLEEVERAQEALSGPYGLLDERRWRREVTVAIAAHQSAFAHAQAHAQAQAHADAQAQTSAAASAHVSQSISSLVQVRDAVESAYKSATRLWREAVLQAIDVVIEGELSGAWEAVWALRDHPEVEVQRASWRAWRALVSAQAPASRDSLNEQRSTLLSTQLSTQLRDKERAQDAAWALLTLGDERGLHQLFDAHSAHGSIKASALVRAAHRCDAPRWVTRVGAKVVSQGGRAAHLAISLEVMRLIAEGGEPLTLTAALSSDEASTCRLAARLIEVAHDRDALLKAWDELARERRDASEVELEAQLERFERGELKTKPKGSAPKWPSLEQWRELAQLCAHSSPYARDRAAQLLTQLPTNSDTSKQLSESLKLLTARYGAPTLTEGALALSMDEARALAFGAYTSLLSLSQDLEALKELTRLIEVDPIGVRALLAVTLRGSGASSLRRAAREALDEHREALGLTEQSFAELLLSSPNSEDRRQGAEMLTKLSLTSALALIQSEDQSVAETAYTLSLLTYPQEALEVTSAALASANVRLRAQAVQRAARVLSALEALGWGGHSERKSAKQRERETGLEIGLNTDEARRYGLNQHDLALIKGLKAHAKGEQLEGDVLVQYLREVLIPPAGQRPAFLGVQVAVAKLFARYGDMVCFEPLKRALYGHDSTHYSDACEALVKLNRPEAAELLLERLLNDPEGAFDADEMFDHLAELRQPCVVPRLLSLFDNDDFYQDDVSRCVLRISGFDERISEGAVWEEMSKKEREAERKRGYQNDTLAQHLIASVRAGRFSDILYYDELLKAAKTARAPAPSLDASLARLFKLPYGDYYTDAVRREAVEVYAWRASHRSTDPTPLTSLLSHRDQESAWAAAEGLALVGRAEGLPPLLQLAKDKVHSLSWRRRAVKALGVCADLRAVRALLRIYDDPEDYLREEALEALGYMSSSEVAGEVRARLIQALNMRPLIEVAIKGIEHMKHPDTWTALREAVRQGRLEHAYEELAVKALRHDESPETTALFVWLVEQGERAARSRSRQVKLYAYEGWRASLGEVLPELTDESKASEHSAPKTLDPERALFKLNVTSAPQWEQASRALALFGEAEGWLNLCFEAAELSDAHRRASARFEAQLRALAPAPLALLLSRLSEATRKAPALAELTLSLIATKAQELSDQERAELLKVTTEVREAWVSASHETLGAPVNSNSTLGERLSNAARTWRLLLRVWARAQGGVSELKAALAQPSLPVELASEALNALLSCVERGEATLEPSLLESEALSAPELSTLVAKLIAVTPALSARALDALSGAQASIKLSEPSARGVLWGALTASDVSPSEALTEALKRAAQSGDPLAFDALVRRADVPLTLELLKEAGADALDERLTCGLIESAALLASEQVEAQLVTIAKGSKREAVVKAAWRARRRSSRARERVSR